MNQAKSTRTVLICAALILMLAMGVRQTFGLFMPPMTIANGWTRDEFALAIALQNLLWGAFVPFAGAIADRFGAGRVLVASAVVYVVGPVLMAVSTTPLRLRPLRGPVHRPRALGHDLRRGAGRRREGRVAGEALSGAGIAGAGGSFGQFAMVPYGAGA